MSKKRRNYEKKSPLVWFKELFGDREGLTRSQLETEDSGLYATLRKMKLLDEAIPEKEHRDWNRIDPVEYFIDLYGSKNITRGELQKEDGVLFLKLRETGFLNILLPSKYKPNHLWDDKTDEELIQFMSENHKGKIITEFERQRGNGRLCIELRKRKLIDALVKKEYS